MTIEAWLKNATNQLTKIGIDSARLDAEVILAHTIRRPRTYLHAHGDTELSDHQAEIAEARLDLRLDRVPIAYIIGHKEFYGRRFKVTTATLIPRPESEDIITTVKELVKSNLELFPAKQTLVDVGTGSGCLGITLKLEIPDLDVTLCDISPLALNVAEQNAKALNADVRTLKSDLLSAYPLKADFIVANLPYVNPSWQRSPETDYEPALALFADNGGIDLIQKLIDQTPVVIKPGGYLILEADPEQHPAIINYAKSFGLEFASALNYCLVLQQN